MTTVKVPNHGREIYGMLFEPANREKYPIVVFSHGYNGSGDDFIQTGEYLSKNGIGAFCYDFCGGSVNTRSSMATTEMTVFTEKEDLHAVIQYLKEKDCVQKDEIYVFGASQGGLVSALVTDELRDEIKGLLLLFPALCIADDWNKKYADDKDIPEVENFMGMDLGSCYGKTIRGFDIFGHVGKFDRKVLIFHGDRDSIVPFAYSQRLEKAYPNAKLIAFPGEDHGFSEAGNKKVEEMTLKFVKLK